VNEQLLDEMQADIKQILKLMNGNGKVGLCAMVYMMWGWGKVVVLALIGIVARLVYVSITKG